MSLCIPARQSSTEAPVHSRAVTVHVVDDDASVRQALAQILSSLGCSVRGHDTAEDFERAYEPGKAECLVLDVGLPGMSGLQLLEQLSRRSMMLPTVVISAHAHVERVVAAIRSGAVDFLEKPPRPPELLERVRAAVDGAEAAARERRELLGMRGAWQRLTGRERDVFDLLGRGFSAKQVAHSLGLSIRTAHIHRTNVMHKLGVENQIELVRAAERLRCCAQSDRS